MEVTNTLNKLINFFTECRIRRSYVKSITIKQNDGVSFQPIPKIQLVGNFDGKRVVRTVIFGPSIFPQIADSFGISLGKPSISYENKEAIIEKEEMINRSFRTFLGSEICKKLANQENGKAKERLVSQLCKEISDRFSLLLSFPNADNIIPDLYNQAQVERVLKS